jgi:hypothetical protein
VVLKAQETAQDAENNNNSNKTVLKDDEVLKLELVYSLGICKSSERLLNMLIRQFICKKDTRTAESIFIIIDTEEFYEKFSNNLIVHLHMTVLTATSYISIDTALNLSQYDCRGH